MHARDTKRVGRLRWLGLTTATVAGLVAATTAACDDNPASPSPTGAFAVMLTDAPAEEVQRVNVFFTSVTVKPAQGSVQKLQLQLAANPVDLLTLDDQVVSLATGAVAPGEYEFIQVDIDQAQSSIVVDGVTKPIGIPSREVKILGPFVVDEGETTSVTLDFDADKSLVPLGSGTWLLKPVIVKAPQGTIPVP